MGTHRTSILLSPEAEPLRRPPAGRWRRLVPLAATAVRLWLAWRWLRLRRHVFGEERLRGPTARFHVAAATALVRRAVKQQGLIIKACQFLGSRADILREEYVRILSLLHDSVPPRPWPEMRALVESELGAPVDELFAEFNPTPVAAASLSQVYRARLADGTDVAVKVQYPEIERIVRWDLQNIRLLTEVWSRLERAIDFRPVIAEMERNAPDEVDFLHEGRAAERFAELLASRDDVVIPGIYWARSSRRVLTMDYIEGIKVTDIDALRAAGIDPPAVAEHLIDVYNTMVLKHGAFHADPHPGNLFVLPPLGPGKPPRIGLVDFGLTKELGDEFRQMMIVLTTAIIAQSPHAVSDTMESMGFRTQQRDEETYYALGEAFLGEVLRSGQAYADQALFAEVNVRLQRVLRENPLVDVPPDVVLIARVMGLLSGLGRTLESETDLMDAVMPYLEEASIGGPSPAGELRGGAVRCRLA